MTYCYSYWFKNDYIFNYLGIRKVNFFFKCVLIEPAGGPGYTSKCLGHLTAAVSHVILMVIKGRNLGEGYKCFGANF